MKDEYLWNTGNQLASIRLLVEGAAILYELDAGSLVRLAMEHDLLAAANALESIGTAIYELRKHIQEMHDEHIKEVVRVIAAENGDDNETICYRCHTTDGAEPPEKPKNV